MSATVHGRRDSRARSIRREPPCAPNAGGDVGDDLGVGGKQSGELLQHGARQRRHKRLRRWAHGGVELDALGGDPRRQFRESLDLTCQPGEAAEQHDLKPELTRVVSAEGDQAGLSSAKSSDVCGRLSDPEQTLVGRIEREQAARYRRAARPRRTSGRLRARPILVITATGTSVICLMEAMTSQLPHGESAHPSPARAMTSGSDARRGAHLLHPLPMRRPQWCLRTSFRVVRPNWQ